MSEPGTDHGYWVCPGVGFVTADTVTFHAVEFPPSRAHYIEQRVTLCGIAPLEVGDYGGWVWAPADALDGQLGLCEVCAIQVQARYAAK